jgi:hypothetical protein
MVGPRGRRLGRPPCHTAHRTWRLPQAGSHTACKTSQHLRPSAQTAALPGVPRGRSPVRGPAPKRNAPPLRSPPARFAGADLSPAVLRKTDTCRDETSPAVPPYLTAPVTRRSPLCGRCSQPPGLEMPTPSFCDGKDPARSTGSRLDRSAGGSGRIFSHWFPPGSHHPRLAQGLTS